jgi:hypothetical protein
LSEGEPLPNWHPLVTGDPQSVVTAGVSVRDVAISADKVTDITEEVIALNKPRYPHDT